MWKPFSPIYIFLDMTGPLGKESRNLPEKRSKLFRIELVYTNLESFKKLACWIKWESLGSDSLYSGWSQNGQGLPEMAPTPVACLLMGPASPRWSSCTANHFKGGLSPTLSLGMTCFKVATHFYRKDENSQSALNLLLQGLMSCLFSTNQSISICSFLHWPPLDWITGLSYLLSSSWSWPSVLTTEWVGVSPSPHTHPCLLPPCFSTWL